MGALQAEDEPALLDEQEKLKNAQAMWKGTTAVLSAGGFAINPAVLVLPILVGAVSITVLNRKQNSVERRLADPPRFDYQVTTRARRRRYVSGTLGESPLALATDQAAIATLRAASYLEASVRADERSQGARIDGNPELAARHLEDAHYLFDVGRRWSGEMSTAWNSLALTWAAYTLDSGLDEASLSDDVGSTQLPPPAREAFARTRLVADDVRLLEGATEVLRAERQRGRARIGEIALDSAISSRVLAHSAGRVSGGLRALPEHATEQSPGDDPNRFEALQTGAAPDSELERRLLLAVEEGSPDALFDMGVITYSRGERSRSHELLDRAAARVAPRTSKEFHTALDSVVASDLPSLPTRFDEPGPTELSSSSDADQLRRYWTKLSGNGRKIFGAAGRIERLRGPAYTLDDIAENLSISLESVRSMHRSTGRTARLWRQQTGTEEPIRLESVGYAWDESRGGNRTSYRLPPGAAEVIVRLMASGE